jgi:hypothetical protein
MFYLGVPRWTDRDGRLPVVTQRSQQSPRSVLSGLGPHDLGLGPDVPLTV